MRRDLAPCAITSAPSRDFLIERIPCRGHQSFRGMRALLAIFMVVLIGNPVCCCAFAMPEARPGAAADLPPCCQARLDTGSTRDSGNEELPPKCPCAAKLGIVAAEKVLAPPPLAVQEIPAPLATAERLRLHPENRPIFGSGPGAGPLFAEFRPPPPRLLYGVFRC